MSVEEAAAKVTPLSSYWPTLEVLAHLAGTSAEQRMALAAVKCIAAHASYEEDGTQRIRVMADGEVQLARGLFQHESRQRMVDQASIAELVLRIARTEGAGLSDEDSALIARIDEYVQQREEKFIADMGLVASGVAEAADQFNLSLKDARAQMLALADAPETLSFAARTRVLSMARSLGVSPSEEEVVELTERVRVGYPVAMAFLRTLVIDAFRGDVNWRRSDRANSVWDLGVAFHASRAATIDGVPILLVTNDNQLHGAAASVGHSAFVARPDEYFALLKSGGVVARETAMLEVPA